MEALLTKVKDGYKPNVKEALTIQAVKTFEYGLTYNSALNLTTPSQVKLSYAVLIPQLTAGTDLDLLRQHMEQTGLSRVYFESAHKVGANFIQKIHNEDGTINPEALKNLTGSPYKYDNEQVQLEIPSHLEDDVNKLATQIAKLVITNLSKSATYVVGGKEYSNTELQEHYFNILNSNIEEDTQKLIEDLQLEKNEKGQWTFKTKEKLQEFLKEEVINRNLSDNYLDALELDENGDFVLPLFINNMSKKWESILTSLFSNRIMRQKIEGASATLTSTFGITNKLEQAESKVEGIEWADSHKENQELKVYVNDKGENVVQVVMGAWSKKFFDKEGNRMSINDIPLDLRQQIAYRIPTASKSYMFVLEVVGLLPEQSKGMIIVPNDMITKTGSDFDIDKFFLMYKNFYKTKSDKFVIPKYSEKEEIELYREYLNELTDELAEVEKTNKAAKDSDLATSVADMKGLFGEDVQSLKDEIEEVKQKMASLGTYDKDSRLIAYNGSRAARNNEIIDIYKAVISHPEHQKEGNIGAEFGLLKDLAATINKIYNKDDKNNSAVTGRYQRELRKRNRTGKDVLGIAANYNMFTAIAQTSGMRLNSSNGFKSKVKIKGEETQYDKIKDVKELEAKYGKENVIIEKTKDKDGNLIETGFAIITHTAIGFSNKDYLNIDNQPILDISSQGLNASADNAKDPTLGTLNLSIFTYPVFHISTAVGQSIENAGFFYIQPILRALTAKIEENKSILNDGNSSGKEREDVRRDYKVKAFTVYFDNFKDRLDAKIEEYNKKEDKKYNSETIMKGLMKNNKFLPKKLTDFLFENDIENIKSFSTQELHDMLVDDSLDITGKLAPAKQIKLYINQMSILNDFGNRKGTSEVVDRVIKATKTDSIGAGAELNVSTKLINSVNRLGEDTTVMIDGTAAVKKIYPKHFSLNEQSKYLPLETYFENVNKLSKEILSPLFITESPAFIDLKRQIGKKIIVTEAVSKKIDNFLNYLTYQNFEMFDKLHFERVLGVNNETNSLAEQFKTIKKEIDSNRNHILNMIQEKNNKSFKELVIKNYKDSGLDTVYASQIEELYDRGGVYKEFVEDLVRYTYFVHSLGYNFDSFAKVLPTKVLESMGMGKYAYQAQSEANLGILFSDDAKELFFRNNSQNKDIVPIVKTKFLKDENNKRIKKIDEDGQEMEGYETINDTPIYELNSKGYLLISKKQLANENNNIKNSDYLNLAVYDSKTKTTSFKLLKKLTLDILPVNTEYKSSVGDIIEIDIEGYGATFQAQILSIEPANEGYSFVTTKNIKSGKKTTYEIHNSLGTILTITNDKDSTYVPDDASVVGFQMSDELLENPTKTPIFDLNTGNNIYYEVNKLGNNGIYETETSVFSQNAKVNEVENYKNALISYLRIGQNNLGFMESTLKEIEERKTTCGI